eukprot:31551-Pelagococcus_subviridis.AAC.3
MARAARANGVVEARLTDGRRGGSDARARRTQVGSEVVQAFGGERPRDVVRAERRQRRVRDARDRLQVRIVARRRRLRLILFLRGRLRPARRRRRRRRPRGAPRRFRGAEPPHDDAQEDAAAWRPSSSAAPLALQSVVASDDVASRHESFSETPRLTDASCRARVEFARTRARPRSSLRSRAAARYESSSSPVHGRHVRDRARDRARARARGVRRRRRRTEPRARRGGRAQARARGGRRGGFVLRVRAIGPERREERQSDVRGVHEAARAPGRPRHDARSRLDDALDGQRRGDAREHRRQLSRTRRRGVSPRAASARVERPEGAHRAGRGDA